ncbi:MAG: hypothetical protein A2293_12400 [Elusimicrobia bacterium RIFOXYB2_FULL_49_7]|nr:MAG: hypothetical protein A2293_12400 [Elusimicrobia bacterium RIFOXYB2_FULL_49_7]
MKTSAFLLFISLALLIYASINTYVFVRTFQALPATLPLRSFYVALFLLLAISFIAGRILEQNAPGALSTLLVWIGSFWFSMLLYGFLFCLTVDLIRLVHHIVPFLPQPVSSPPERIKSILLVLALMLIATLHIVGFLQARRLHIREISLTLPARQSSLSELHVAVASDFHLGTIIGRRRLQVILERLNQGQPDLVLLIGDILDEDPQSAIRQKLDEMLRLSLNPRLGTFAVTGNHEYIGSIHKTAPFLASAGITLLRDSIHTISNGLRLVGREDLAAERFFGQSRKPLGDILSGNTADLPLIVMDHQPARIQEAAEAGADLLLCGHTHAGQFWPINLIVNRLFRFAYGYGKMENLSVYVSSGAGTWGPPIRLSASPEVVHLRLHFQREKRL